MTTIARVRRPRTRQLGEDTTAFIRAAERITALVTTFSLGMRISVYAGITVGAVLAVLLSPVWASEIRRHRGGVLLISLGAFTLLWGVMLAWVSSGMHGINTRQLISFSAFLVQLVVGVGVVWWARRVLGVAVVCLAFAVGMIAQGLLIGSQGTGNPWKALYAVPVAIAVLSLLYERNRRLLELIALLALAVTSGLQDSRSYSATFLIAAVLVLWQMRPQTLTRRGSVSWTAFLIAGVGYGAYQLGQALLIAGYLGADAQQRTIAQIRQAGSLIYGGRPELKATIALMEDDPWGHGVGVLPTYHDIQVAKSAMSEVIYNPNNGYVEKFMFGNDIELHSILGDLWTHFGLAGIAFVVLIAVTAFRTIIEQVVHRRASGLVLFLALWTLWNLLFSPFYSAIPTLTLLFGLGFGLRERAQSASPSARPAGVATPQRTDGDRDAAQRPAHDGA